MINWPSLVFPPINLWNVWKMAETRKVDKFARDKRALAGKLRVRRQKQEDRLKEIMSNSTTPDKLQPVRNK